MTLGRATQLVQEGIAAAQGGKHLRARVLLREAIALDPRNFTAWMWAAGVAEHPKEAVQALEKSLQLNPRSVAARTALSIARLEAGVAAARAERRDEARQWLRQAAADEPRNESTWLWLASVTDEPAEAIGYLENALKLNPSNQRAQTGIEHFRSLANREWYCPICEARSATKFVACPECRAVLDLARGDAAIGNPSPDVDKIRTGAARLASEVKVRPDFVGHYYLGMALLNLGKPEEAVIQFRIARSMRPTDQGLQAQVDLLERALGEAAPPTCRIVEPAVVPVEKTILVVDPSPIARRLVGMTVCKRGYKLVEAQDSHEALEMIQSQEPDLVVMDVAMPGMDGFALCKAIRNNPATSGIPVIILSAQDGAQHKSRGKTAGADHCLAKPFEPADLVRLVNDYCPLDGSRASKSRGCP